MSYQNVTIVGNVGRDAEIAYTKQAIAVTKFSVAVNKTTGKGDAKRQKTTWFNVTLWRERAEALVPYIKSGMLVLVTGEVSVSPYIDKKTGNAAASLELNAADVQLLTSKQEMERRANGEYDEPETEASTTGGGRRTEEDDEIPF
ncbi:MAG: single-stranded DNA-binding protein [Aggregatilineales bacterium]